MTNTSMPPHLERIGRQLTAAADDLSRAPRRSRGRAIRVLAASTTGLAAMATAAVLAVGLTTNTPPAFAVTRHDGSVSLTINRPTSIRDVNRKLAAMGIEKISKQAMAAGEDLSSIPNCSSIPPGWHGEWVQMAGSSSGPGYKIYESVPRGTWELVMCASGLNSTGSGNTGTTDNTGSGSSGTTGNAPGR